MQRPRDIDDCITGLRPFDLKFLSYFVRRLRDQLLEQVPWDVPSPSQMFGQDGVILGTLDQLQKARIRESCAGIDGDRIHDRLVASCHEYIGDRLVDRFSPWAPSILDVPADVTQRADRRRYAT